MATRRPSHGSRRLSSAQAHRDARRGRTATPAPVSRCSRRRACPAPVRRRSPTRRSSTASPASRRPSRCTSRGTRSTTTPTWPRYADDHGVGSARSTPTSSRTTTTSSARVTNPDPAVRRKAIDHLLECVDIMDAHRLARPEAVVRRRHQLPRPGRHRAPARTGSPTALREVYDRLGDDQRMLLEYKLFEPAFYATDVPDWGTAYAHCPSWAERAVVCSTPATTRRARTSSSSSPSCCAGQARRLRLQLPLLRRRRPHGRRRRPVPALPDHARGRPRRRPRPRLAGIAFMLDQCHNIEAKIPGDHPLGDERAGGDRQGAARRPRRARRRPARRRRARRQRGPDGRLQHRRAAACSPTSARSSASTPTRWRPTALRLPRADRRRARRRHAGRLGRLARGPRPPPTSDTSGAQE